MSYDTITGKFTGHYAVGMTCWCSVQFAVPRSLYDFYERSNEDRAGSVSIFCPLGHQMVPGGKSSAQREAQRLRDELAREKHRTEQARADADYQRTRAVVTERQLAARKGQLTKMRNRVGNGVCPCCNRYFANLHRHMSGQHPDWAPESEGEATPNQTQKLAPVRATTGTAADWKKLAQRRRTLGVSVATTAQALGLKASTLRLYESGNAFSLRAALRCVKFLDGRLADTAKGTAKAEKSDEANDVNPSTTNSRGEI